MILFLRQRNPLERVAPGFHPLAANLYTLPWRSLLTFSSFSGRPALCTQSCVPFGKILEVGILPVCFQECEGAVLSCHLVLTRELIDISHLRNPMKIPAYLDCIGGRGFGDGVACPDTSEV